MKTTAVVHGMCLSCGYSFDSASAVSQKEAVPRPGDLTICLNCGNLMRFDDRMRAVPASEADLEAVSALDRRGYELARQLIRDRGPLKIKEPRN